jgi:putative oxidoreductase
MSTYSKYQNAALLILRLITAAIFYVAAWYKIPFWSNPPQGMSSFLLFTIRLVSIAEPLGATGVLLGLLTRLAAGGLTIVLLGAICVMQFVYHIGFVTPTSAGWNMPLAVMGGTIILMAFGAGDWSMDKGKR